MRIPLDIKAPLYWQLRLLDLRALLRHEPERECFGMGQCTAEMFFGRGNPRSGNQP